MNDNTPYRPVGENPDPTQPTDPGAPASPIDDPPPAEEARLVHVRDDNPAHDSSAAPDD